MKDRRYNTVLKLLQGGHIKELAEIFDTVPRSVVAKDIRKNKDDLDARMEDLPEFSLRELARIARLIEVTPEEIINIVTKEISAKNLWPSVD